jgi:hypothetical protein
MREAGATGPLTTRQVRAWGTLRDQPPDWYVALLARKAARATRRQEREERREFERQHRMVLLADSVERKLLAGKRRFSDPDAEHIAADLALRAMKDLVRGGDLSQLSPLDLAALRWAGVDPTDHTTWLGHDE